MKREGARPVAVLEVRRPASVSQYVRRFRPCRRSDCGIVHGRGIKGQCVTAFALRGECAICGALNLEE
jgi:hypothetical protein